MDVEQIYQETFNLALKDPEVAMPMIQVFEEAFKDEDACIQAYIHYLYLTAYANLAVSKYENLNIINIIDDNLKNEIISFCEKICKEYHLTTKLAQYEETETYQEEVVIKQAGIFRKAQIEMQTKTRVIRKSRIDQDMQNFMGALLEQTSILMEKLIPDYVQKILGEIGKTKLKYLLSADCIFWAPIIAQAIDREEGSFINKADIREICNFWVEANGVIRYATVSVAASGSRPELLVMFWDGIPIENDKANITGSCTFKKEEDVWSIDCKFREN